MELANWSAFHLWSLEGSCCDLVRVQRKPPHVSISCGIVHAVNDTSNLPLNMGATASQASLVISHSSVRGLSDACWNVANLGAVLMRIGANAPVVGINKITRVVDKEIIMVLKVYLLDQPR